MKKLSLTLFCCLLVAMTAWAQFDSAPAFPGAEGYGRYTTGGRGGEIRHVTNLNDSGTGSFRAAVNGNSKKIVVFDVAGVIALESDLTIGDNTTVLGQTAPGDGITLRYWTVRPGGNNIIRFIRFRRGQERNVDDGADATWQRQKSNIILDHCSFSWSIDEVASYYDNKDFTMQWCTIGEPLKYSGHKKGPHGYGGIWGGKGASFHHNLLIHLDNRAPRLNGARFFWKGPNGTEYPNVESCIEAEKVDLRNCVIYNTGTGNGAYGGMGGNHNIVNNYYKAGPATKNTKRVFQCSVSNTSDGTGTKDVNYPGGIWGKFYISGNYVTAAGSSAANYDWTGVTIDNCKDADVTTPTKDQLKISEVETGSITTHTAEVAYEKVLSYAGASKSRDCIDTRYAREVRSNEPECIGSATSYEDDKGTHSLSSSDHPKGIIDVTADALLPHGGVYTLSAGTPIVDSDNDGIPDAWETAHGLNPNTNDANLYTIDNVSNGGKGFYTNIEVYANSLVEDIMKNENKDAQTTFNEYYPLDDDPSALLPTTINASPASVSITGTASATVTLSSNNSSGAYSITTQPNASIATASISGNTVTITGVAAGTTSLIVSQDASSTQDAATKTISITVSDAQGAASTIFSLNVTSSSTLSLAYQESSSIDSYATIEGGSASVYNGKNSSTAQNMVSSKAVNLGGSSGSYLHITLANGKTFAAGDVITITTAGNWKASKTTSGATTITAPYTVKNTDAFVNGSDLYIFKTGTSGDPSTIESITITREAPETPDPDPVAVKPAAKKGYDFVVGRDGTIDEAIAAANAAGGTDRYLIFVPDGTHNMTATQSWTLGSDKSAITGIDGTTVQPGSTFSNNATWLTRSNVSIIGQSMLGTKLQNKPNFPGISYTSTLEISKEKTNTYIQDLTLYNNYANGANDKGVAVAFYDRGTNTIAKNLNAWSNQDTYVSAATRCYYETSTFAGTVDFICGSGDVWFEQCDLVINNRGGNVITAPSTAATEQWGYIFNGCTISKAEGATQVTDKNWNLGRPWKNAPASTFINTKMNVLPKDAGWTNMTDGLAIRFHEYGSTNSSGTLLDLTSRSVSACKGAKADNPVLTEVQASKYKVSSVVGGDNNWDPRALTLQVGVSNVQLNGNTLLWDANDYALCWVVFKDGVFYDDVTENSITLSETGTYTVRAANSMGGLGQESAGMEYENMPATSTVVWDFAKYTEKVSSFTTLDYSGLTLVGNIGSESDYVSASAGFHMNGPSSSTIRHIKFTPQYDGKVTVYYRSNNSSANDRITAIGTAVETGNNVETLLAKANVLAAGYTQGSTQQTISANLTAGTTYYLYFANGGQSIMKVEYSHSVENQNTLSATVASTRKFGSFSSLYNVDFGTDENAAVQAYTVKVKDATSVVLTRHYGVLPAGEGVVLYAPDATKSQTFNVAASATALTIDNDMIGVPVATNVEMDATGGHAYVVNSDAFKPLSASGTIAAGKAYIRIPSSSGGAKAISMMFNDDNATGISNYDFFSTNTSVNKIYNLQGIEVKNPIRGRIYIINNKKCIFK